MRAQNNYRVSALILIGMLSILFFMNNVTAQEKTPNIRVAKLLIDPAKIDAYKAALKEEIDASIQKEPGVLSLYAVYEKKEPSHVTVFEIYASEEAYRSHIQTPHFKKYKASTADMVKSLELTEMAPIALGSKPKLPAQ